MIVFGIIQGLYIMQFDGRTQKKEQKLRGKGNAKKNQKNSKNKKQ